MIAASAAAAATAAAVCGCGCGCGRRGCRLGRGRTRRDGRHRVAHRERRAGIPCRIITSSCFTLTSAMLSTKARRLSTSSM